VLEGDGPKKIYLKLQAKGSNGADIKADSELKSLIRTSHATLTTQEENLQ
jgi:hypothetical protein